MGFRVVVFAPLKRVLLHLSQETVVGFAHLKVICA